jgi:hypothetical protein
MGWIEADDGEYGRVNECELPLLLGDAGINETVFPDVTTMRPVCGDSSMDVMGFAKLRLSMSCLVRKSHHLYSKLE